MNRGLITFLAAVAGMGSVALTSAPAQAGTLRWSGRVDDTATISLHGRDVRVSATMHGVKEEKRVIQGALPMRPTRVTLDNVRGRGRVQIIQQPSPRNNFTAQVRITDPDAGASFYRFNLHWERNDDSDWHPRRRP